MVSRTVTLSAPGRCRGRSARRETTGQGPCRCRVHAERLLCLKEVIACRMAANRLLGRWVRCREDPGLVVRTVAVPRLAAGENGRRAVHNRYTARVIAVSVARCRIVLPTRSCQPAKQSARRDRARRAGSSAAYRCAGVAGCCVLCQFSVRPQLFARISRSITSTYPSPLKSHGTL